MTGRCRHELSWNPEWSCSKRGWLAGTCVEHALWKLRWEWRTARSVLSVDLSNVNRPYLLIDDERPIEWIAVQWGNGNGDPVWSLQLNRRRR